MVMSFHINSVHKSYNILSV